MVTRFRLFLVTVIGLIIAISIASVTIPAINKSELKAETLQDLEEPGISEVFDKSYILAMSMPPEQAVYLLPTMLNELMPQGIIILLDPEYPEETHMEFERFSRGVKYIINVTEYIARNSVDPNVTTYALMVESFINYVSELAMQASKYIASGYISELSSSPVQLPRYDMFWWFRYPLISPYWIPKESVVYGEIPLWGSLTVVEKSKGVKFLIDRTDLPWWWGYPYPVWHIKIVPAEFIKVISIHNVYNFTEGKPEIVEIVDTRVVLENELIDFWAFLEPPIG
jgi:hypothetical protein